MALRLLAATALLVAGCGVNAGGQIPCADDSTCPRDYPVCSGATPAATGRCVAGTSTSINTVAIIGVDGHGPADFLRQTVRLSATARALSGVKSLSLTGGGKTFTPAAASAPPLYYFSIDTTQISDGDQTFTATLVAGDDSQATASTTLHIDNTVPAGTLAFRSNGLATMSAAAGGNVQLDFTISAGHTATLNGVDVTGSTSKTFNSVTTNTTFMLLVTNRAGAMATPPIATFTATPNFLTFSADTSAMTASTAGTVTFVADFLPGGTGGTTGTITASSAVFSGPSTTTSITSGSPLAVTVTPPSSPGTLVFTLSAGGASNASTVGITVYGAVTGATLGAGPSIITAGTSTTLSPFLGTNGASGVITSNLDPNFKLAITNNNSITVSPLAPTTYTLVSKNAAGTAAAGVSATVTVMAKASISALPSAVKVSDGDVFSVTATVSNATAAGSSTVSLFQNSAGDCATGQVGPPVALSISSGVGTATFSGGAVNATVAGPGGTGTSVKYCVSVANVTGPPSTAPLSITLYSAPLIASFVTNTPVLAKGGTTTFNGVLTPNGGSASIIDDAGCTLDNTGGNTAPPLSCGAGGGTALTITSSVDTTPATTVNRTTRYTLLVTNGAGKLVSKSVTVSAFNTVVQTVQAMTPARFDATATRLLDGRVLIAGGASTEGGTPVLTATIFDASLPGNDRFVATGNMTTPRRSHTAHLLSNGTVLIVGGYSAAGTTTALATVELFDPTANSFSAFSLDQVCPGGVTTTCMKTTHAMHVSVALPNGSLLVAGGCTTSGCNGANDGQHAEIISITSNSTGAVSVAASGMQVARYQATGTLFDSTASGRTLIAGGAASANGAGQASGEVWNGTAFTCVGSVTAGTCTTPATMTNARAQHAAALLPNGKVALFGGIGVVTGSGSPVSAIEIYDPATAGSFSTPGSGNTVIGVARFGLTATKLGGAGRILVAGGFTAASVGVGTTASQRLDLFDVSAAGVLAAVSNPTNMDNLKTARGGHVVAPIFGTEVLITGGTTAVDLVNGTGELFSSFQ
jgi:hypothetical protein